MFASQNVSASELLSTRDMTVRPGRDVTDIVCTFLTVAEAVVAAVQRLYLPLEDDTPTGSIRLPDLAAK
mgnify:CR=1 FL=1